MPFVWEKFVDVKNCPEVWENSAWKSTLELHLRRYWARLHSVICFLECVLATLSIIKFIVGALTSSNTLVVFLIPSPWVFLYIQKCPKKVPSSLKDYQVLQKTGPWRQFVPRLSIAKKQNRKLLLCNKVDHFTFSRRRTTIIFAIYGEIKVTLCCHVFCFFFWPSNWGNGVAL